LLVEAAENLAQTSDKSWSNYSCKVIC